MAKKGKGKKDKGVKSEFGIYKDEESRRKAMEEIRCKQLAKQEAEEKNFRLNNLKLQNRWRDIMKLAKTQELQTQIEILRQVHSRRVDRKDASLGNLKSYIDEAETQFSNALQSHLINIDTLIELQDSRLSVLKDQFEADLAILDTEFNTERFYSIKKN
jgi:hypothetical protein